MDTSRPPRGAPLVGQTFRSLEIIQELGAAPFGQVYLARDQRHNRLCVVKSFDPAIYSRDALRQTHKIATAASDLLGADAPAIYDVVLEGASQVLVSEYVPGEGLDDLRRAHGRLSWDDARSIFSQVARVLAAAHAGGLHHGDISPRNIRLRPSEDGTMTPILVGWGTGAINPSNDEHTQVDVRQAIDYHAPEQIRGGPTSSSTDMYAVGVLLFEAVTGRRPFIGAPSVVAMDHIRQPPPSPRQLNLELSWGAESLLLSLLEKEPGQRLSSKALLREFEKDEGPVGAESITSTDIVSLSDHQEPKTQVYIRQPHTAPTQILMEPPQPPLPTTSETIIVGVSDEKTGSTSLHSSVTRFLKQLKPGGRPQPTKPLRTRLPQWVPKNWTSKHTLLALNLVFGIVLLLSASVILFNC